MKKETTIRSIVKTLTWRFVATLATIIIVFLLTADFSIAFKSGFIEVIAKLIIYYGHERAWNMTDWGIAKESIVDS